MEASVGLTTAVGLLVIIAAAVVGKLVMNRVVGKTPPIFEGIPFIGGLIKFVKGPMGLMTDGYALCGEVFTVPVAHKRITFLIGPDVSPHFFKAADDDLSQTEKVRTEQFRFFTEALKKDRLKQYVPMFIKEAEDYFKNWAEEGEIDFMTEFTQLVTLTAARTLLGREVRENVFERVSGLLHDLDEGMLPISVMFPYLPIPAHFKRDKARQALHEIFGTIIRARRASGVKEQDVLQQFIDAKYQNVNGGRALEEHEIAGLLIAEKALAPAIEEQKRAMKEHGDALDFDILQGMDVMHRNITEALRMHPPLIMLLRYCKTAFNVTDSKGKEFVVPKGDVVAASPNFSHMLPHVFKNPTVYDPDRFLAPRDEDKATPYGFIGFGGGRHGCLGSNFAYLQIKAIWSVLLRNFEFELIDPVPAPDYHSMVIGPLPCRVKYKRRKLTL
eukprot:gene3621-13706_t